MSRSKPTMQDVIERPHSYYQCVDCRQFKYYCHGKMSAGPIVDRMCVTCKRQERNWIHGTRTTYGKGCRCGPCRESNMRVQREHAAKFKEVYGVIPSQVQVITWYTFTCANSECRTVAQSKHASGRYCSKSCRATVTNSTRCNRSTEVVLYSTDFASTQAQLKDFNSRAWITRKKRKRIYERDDYRCHSCGVVCSKEFSLSDRTSATLDHAVPWIIWRLSPHVDDEFNLLTSCRGCNYSRKTQWDRSEWVSLLASVGAITVDEARTIRGLR